MLGELYKPKGLALETAQAVLEAENVYAVNVAWGCPNGCSYCYGPKVSKQSRQVWMTPRYPKVPPVDLVRRQLERGLKPDGVFISFETDPFLPGVEDATEELIEMLIFDYDVRVATLSKMGVSCFSGVRHGVSIVSLDEEFWMQHEPRTLRPNLRLSLLEDRGYGWISMEPYPPSAIYKQNFKGFLEYFKDAYVDLIIFGKWNYDSRSRTEEARKEYADNISILTDFCKSNDIRLHIKSDTVKIAKKPILEDL